jgi:actin-related protein
VDLPEAAYEKFAAADKERKLAVNRWEAAMSGYGAGDDDKPVVIIDNGSGHMKAGLAGQDVPSSVFPAVVGRPKHGQAMAGSEAGRDYFMGDEALGKRGVLSISYPIEHGIVKDWADMEKVWHYTFFDHLRVEPESHPILVTEAPMNPKKNRERMVEMLFEKFSVPACYIVIQAVMSLYSYGRTTGCVVDSGDGVTHTVPVYEGYCSPHAIQRMDLAGRDISQYMERALCDSGYNMTSSSEKDIVRQMKESHCYVADDYEAELKKAKETPIDIEKEYVLPDGNKVTLSTERFKVPEALFNPMLTGREMGGIHEATSRCIQSCDIDLRRDLYKNIVLSGGNTLFPGIAERLTKEVKALAPNKVDVKVIASPQRRYLVWMGASVVANLSTFHKMLIWKADYDDVGSSIVHQKCF